MNLKHHKNLAIEKWRAFSFGKQILMIADELNRAKNRIIKNDGVEVKLCYKRALELVYLTIACVTNRARMFELCRFKEVLAGLFIEKKPSLEKNTQLYTVLLSLSSESFALLNP